MGITDTFAINRSTFSSLPYDDERDFARAERAEGERVVRAANITVP
jgi:hypothetical protein